MASLNSPQASEQAPEKEEPLPPDRTRTRGGFPPEKRTVRQAFGGREEARGLDGFFAALAGANPNDIFEGGDENLAVADLARVRGRRDGAQRILEFVVGDNDFELDLGQEVHDVLGASVDFGVPLLATKPLDLAGCHALDADGVQGFLDIVDLEGFDDGFDFLHGALPLG